jgi:hypothetical protein
MKASDLTLDGYNTFLFKGPYGFGKTIAAASWALLGPTYIAYWDKKKPIELRTFFTERRFGSKAQRILDNIEWDLYGSNNAHDYLNKVIGLSKDCRYVNFITDSVTNMTAGAVNWSMGFRSAKQKKDKENKEAPQMLPDFDEYKVETSLVSQALDICKTLPCNIIWTAHPLPSIKIEGTGAAMRVTKTNPIVTYGSKVAGMIPGNFAEIYHFTQLGNWDAAAGTNKKKFIVSLEAIGDEFAKSPLLGDYVKELDLTDRLMYEVWKEALDSSQGKNVVVPEPEQPSEETQPTTNLTVPKWRV